MAGPTRKRTADLGALFDNITKRQKSNQTDTRTPSPQYHRSKPGLSAKLMLHVAPSAMAADERMVQTYHECAARLKGFDTNGKALRVPGLPSQAQLDALEAEEKGLFRPLNEETIAIQIKQPNGTFTTKEYTMQRVIQAFQQRSTALKNDVATLMTEIKKTKEELAKLEDDLTNGKDEGLREAKELYEREMARIQLEVETAGEEREQELQKLSKEEEKAEREWKSRLEALMKAV
jgi:chromosome segregation ATPase